jgi:hypothetical protein
MSFARTLASIASIIGLDANNNLVFTGNLGVGNSTVNSGNVLQVTGNTFVSGSTTVSNAIIINNTSTFNNQTTLNGTTTFNGTATFTKAISENKGAAVASASTTDIWTNADGNLLHVTGTTTIISLGTAPQAGAKRTIIFDGVLTITYNASTLVLPGSTNITTAAGDVWEFVADTTTKMIGAFVSVSKLPAVDGSTLTAIPQLSVNNNWQDSQTIIRSVAPTLNLTNTTAPGVTSTATGGINFYANNSASALKNYAQIYTYLQNATAAAESSWIVFANIISGTNNWRFAIGAGLFSQNASGGDKGVDTVNVKSYFKDGVQQYSDILPWVTVPAASDFSVTSQTVLQNHPTLQISVTSGVSYEVNWDLFCTSPTTGGGKVSITGPTTSRSVGGGLAQTNNGLTYTPMTTFTLTIDSGAATITNASYRGTVWFTASANGTVIVQYAQVTSNGTASVMHAASFLRYRII